MRTRVRRWRSGSGWSPATAGCAAGTGSSRRAPAPRRPSGCCAPTAVRSWPRNCRRWSRRSTRRWRSATARSRRWSSAASAAEAARHAALAAERDARDAARAIDVAAAALERIEAQREGFAQRQAISSRCSKPRARRVAAAERSLAALPDPAALEQHVEAARGRPRQRPHRRLPTSAPKPRPRRAKPPPTASARAPQRASRPTGASAQATPSSALARRIERQKQQAAERAELEREPAELDGRSPSSSAPTTKARSRIGEASAAEREAEEAVVAAAQRGRRRPTSVRPTRASAAPPPPPAPKPSRRAAPSSPAPRSSKFECVPQRLPEKLGFDADEPRDADAEAATLERLTAERERIGPVNLVAEAELAELDADPHQGRRGGRRADPGDPPPARLDRQPQPRGPGPAARGL